MTLSAIVLYFYTRDLLQNEIEEELYSNKDRIEKLLREDQSIKGIPPIMMVEKVDTPEILKLKDTLIYDPLQNEIELFEQLSETTEIDGQHYKVTVRAMVIESENILFAIVFSFIGVLLLSFLFLFYLNKSRNQELWKPFFINLNRLKSFSLKSNQALVFEDSDVLEFHELTCEMENLTTKIQIDYRNLKQFTEDVSHEMQTPLAIMQAKIDTMINQVEISDVQFNEFSSLQMDISRLKKLNKKLILLAKIDNNQFTGTESTSINETFKETIQNMQDLVAIDIELLQNSTIKIQMDGSLARVLCNNLLSNAIRHNYNNQPIRVIIEETRVQVVNSGTGALYRPEQIFERFYKEGKNRDSTGLGLSIVKKICDYYGFVPSYTFKESKHVFQIDFK